MLKQPCAVLESGPGPGSLSGGLSAASPIIQGASILFPTAARVRIGRWDHLDNQRLFLWVGLALVLWFTYQTWVGDFSSRPAEEEPAAIAEQPESTATTPDGLPDLPTAEATTSPEPAPELSLEPAGRRVRVITDVLEVEIDPLGADIRQAVMLSYPVRKDRPDELMTLLSETPDSIFRLHTGVAIAAELDRNATFESARDEYVMRESSDDVDVVFRRREANGVEIRKIFHFERGSYHIRIDYEIINNGVDTVVGRPYMEILRDHKPVERSMTSVETYSFRGPVIFDGEKYDKLDVEDLVDEPVAFDTTRGWIAGIQHHFLVAAIPESTEPVKFDARVIRGAWLLRAIEPPHTTAAASSTAFSQHLFIGPKLQDQLASAAEGLKLTADYGFLTILSQPLFWLLSKVHSVIGNWGWSIVIITILIKLLFYRLSQTSGRSMAKMRKLQPRIKHLQERYKDDRQKLSQAMMEMYKKEKVNPAAGCLPILVQMPVFLAFYWVLLESVELRQAHFMLWITDLSSRDPFFILPILMGAAMLGQQRLNPAPPDPLQAKIMMAMPIVFTVFFAFFPAGLVLYWFVNTLLSIVQQWRINKVTDASR